jgi:hypothetical protein
MKTLKIMSLAMLVITMVSCSDDETAAGLSSEEQAEMVSAALGESGFATTAEQSAVYANESLEAEVEAKANACGYSTTESLSITNPAGTLITYAYSYEYEAALVCNNATPESLTTSFTYSGEFDAPRLASANSGDGALSVSSLEEVEDVFEVNGSYSRTGSFSLKARNKNSGNSVVVLLAENVMVNKASYEIESGSASATITGEVDGEDFTFTAAITFLGDGTATIVIEGITYVSDLESGEITVQ